MRIGEMVIHTRNMSRNQRAYWREMKRVFDDITSDGFNISGQEFIETYTPSGKIYKHQIEEAKQLTGETLMGYSKQFDETESFIDNLTDDLSPTLEDGRAQPYIENIISRMSLTMPVTRRGRQRRKSNGEIIKEELAKRLKSLVNKYGYQTTYDAWMEIPYEMRAKVDSSNAKDRYEGYEGILTIFDSIIEELVYGYEDFDMT